MTIIENNSSIVWDAAWKNISTIDKISGQTEEVFSCKKIKIWKVKDVQKYEIYEPGRILILGDHADWPALYQVSNPSIYDGHSIIAGL